MRPIFAILMLACCAPLSLGQKTPAQTPAKAKVAEQAEAKVFSRQFRKSAMMALQAWSKYADASRNIDDKRQWDVYRDEAERTSVVDKMDDKRRTDAYKDEADRASVMARGDAENLADHKGFICLMRYEGLVMNSQLARDEIRLWQAKTMGERLVPNAKILDEAARYKEQEAAGGALEEMLDAGEVRDCPWGEKTVATAAMSAILRNGFRIRHSHRLVMGHTTRLFLADDESSFTDVPTEDIIGYEPEKHP